jgi:hypothetical protein
LSPELRDERGGTHLWLVGRERLGDDVQRPAGQDGV